ncbi:MAG: hypothetical protein ACYC8T_02535, partial [Myxococcaceae bacterium]
MENATPHPYTGYGRLSLGEFESRTKRTLLAHPFSWVANKAAIFPSYWFAGPGSIGAPDTTSGEYVQNAIYLLASLLIVLIALRDLLYARADAISVFAAALVLTHLLVFVVLHFEVRYMFPLKLGAVFLCLLLLARNASRITKALSRVRGAQADSSTRDCSPGAGR